VLFGICVLMFADVLSGYHHGILSGSGADLASEFYYWRQFGFSELRHGHLAQWNPYVYGGVPFFGGWQAGLLYPPNWLYLFVPLEKAINLDIFISTYLTGLFMALLARKFGFHPTACVLAGIIGMFNGSFFPHIYAGHLATLASMAWAPLILLALDSVIDRPNLRSVLLGGFAFAMQILAGHPQTVYNTIVMLALYAFIRLIKSPARVKVIAALASMAAMGVLLTAVQVLTGLQVNTEGTRSVALPYWFATAFSFPPENFLTMIAPQLFGDINHVQYWGRWYLWETCAFVSVTALPLIALGIAWGSTPRRRLWVTMIAVLGFIALGKYTGFYQIIFTYLPGLSKFRSPAKFLYEAWIFLTLLAAAGLDAVIRRSGSGVYDEKFRNGILAAVMAMALLGLAAAIASMATLAPAAVHLIVKIVAVHESLGDPNTSDVDGFMRRAQLFAAKGLCIASGMSFIAGALLIAVSRCRHWAAILVAVACAELMIFDRTMVTTFDPIVSRPPIMTAWFNTSPGDYRVIQNGSPTNATMAYKAFDLWGYDPMVLRRYSEFVIASEHGDVNSAGMYAILHHPAESFRLLRLKYMFEWSGATPSIATVDGGLPHALLVYQFRVITGRDKIFDAILDHGFSGRQDVILEKDPGIVAVQPAAPGSVSAKWVDSDTLQVDAWTPTPGIILITDAYSRFFHATSLSGSAQASYRVMPANYMEIGVAVGPGHHRFQLNYCPPAFAIGKWISILALIGFGALWRLSRRQEAESADLDRVSQDQSPFGVSGP